MDLAVTEDSRGLGIGTKLINAAIEWSKEKKLDYVELGVLSNNEGARKLYEKLGFEDVTQLMRYKLTK